MTKTKDIKDFDIILVSSGNWLGETIQDFIGSNINHTGIFVWLEGKLYVSEAEKRGLQLVPFEDYPKTSKYKAFYIAKPNFDISRQQKQALKHFILKETRKHPYDFLSLVLWQPIRLITRKIFKHAVWLGKKGTAAGHRLDCSEWAAYVYNKFFGLFKKWYLADPKTIQNADFFNIDTTEIQPLNINH